MMINNTMTQEPNIWKEEGAAALCYCNGKGETSFVQHESWQMKKIQASVKYVTYGRFETLQ